MIASSIDSGGAPDLLVKAEEPDYASVITQVTKRESPRAPPTLQTTDLEHNVGGPGSPASQGKQPAASPTLSPAPAPPSLSTKLQHLLCCFAPPTASASAAAAAPGPPTNRPPGKRKDRAPAKAPLCAQANAAAAAAAYGCGYGYGPAALAAARLANVPNVPWSLRQRDALLGPKRHEDSQKKTLVLDLDETLVHSSFKPIPSPDFVIPVEIEGRLVDVYVLKRPWLDHFMESIGDRYEVVVFTASLSKYADPLLDLLDKAKVVRWRLFREACLAHEGNYVKDLAYLGRELQDVIIVDNSPHSYVFQPANALPIGTFIDNMEDQELLDLLPVLQQTEFARDVRAPLEEYIQALDAAQAQAQEKFMEAAINLPVALGGGGGLPIPRTYVTF